MFSSRRAAAFAAVFALVASACSSTASSAPTGGTNPTSGTSAAVSKTGCTVGVSWNNYQEERWAKWDEPSIKAALAAGGATYINNDAKSSSETQITNVEQLITQGAKVVIILAQDGTAIEPAVKAALQQGVSVIAYDRLIEDPGALYITFDNVEVGRMQAAAVFAAKPSGNYVIIKGSPTDANANFLRQGMDKVIKSAVDAGTIKIVGETYTDNWDPSKAQTEMEQYLTTNNNKVDAVISENDGMAGGVVAALKAQGMAGTVPVSGQDGDAAALNRIALGTQTVDVWKDARLLGKTAGDAAVAMCGGATLTQIAGTKPFTSPGGNTLTSILLTPQAITKDNLNVVLDAKWIDKATLCQGVTAGSVGGC
jgi:D-xylose transport system substrate-binding protein